MMQSGENCLTFLVECDIIVVVADGDHCVHLYVNSLLNSSWVSVVSCAGEIILTYGEVSS